MKFKVGDRVIVEKSNVDFLFGSHEGKHGKIVGIMPNHNGCLYHVAIDNDATLWCEVKCLESEEKTANHANTEEKILITHDGKTTTATMYRADGSKEQATARCCPEDTFDFNVGAKLAMERLMEKTKPVIEPKKFNVNFNTGDYAKIVANKHGHEFAIGTVVRLKKLPNDYEATDVVSGDFWYVVDDELEAYTPPKYYNGKVVCTANKFNGGTFIDPIPIRGFTIGKVYDVVDGKITNDEGWTSNGTYRTIRDICFGMGNTFTPLVEDVKENKNEPLTTDELMKMDGQKVWLSSLVDGKENFTDEYCGWYTVKHNRVEDDAGVGYFVNCNDDYYGFKAYRVPPKEVKE